MTTSLAITSAGTEFFVGAAPATYDAGGFGAVSFTQVAEITNIGSLGKKYNVVKHMPVDSRQVVKRRGSFDNGTLQLKLAQTSDAGQAFINTAQDSDASISVKIVLPGSAGTLYVTAQITSFITDIGSVDQILGSTIDLELDNNIIKV